MLPSLRDSQNGLSYRRPSVIRFVYADRPTWWPDSIAYSCDAFKVMGRDVLEPLHKTIITVGRRVTCGTASHAFHSSETMLLSRQLVLSLSRRL